MASNNRTPKSVLSAPTFHPFIVAQPLGLSRAERRAHLAETKSKKPLLKRVFNRA